MTQKLKDAGIFLLKTLVSAIITVLITRWAVGTPLTGLVQLRGLSQSLLHGSVPSWAFALVLLVSLLSLWFVLTHWPARKGTVHFVPDANNNGWSPRHDGTMDLRLCGTFTYDGPKSIHIVQMFLQGTTPTNNLMIQLTLSGLDRPLHGQTDFWLNKDFHKVFTNLTLRPCIGKKGFPLRTRLILKDKFNNDHRVGPIEFPYIGPR